jgi:hypothetical protein
MIAKLTTTLSSPYSWARALKGAAVALSLVSSAAAAQAMESPFSNLDGSWSGPGTITLASGAKERIRCRATYNVDRAGNNLSIALRCASESYKFELQSSVSHANGAVSGFWNETTYGVGGTISSKGAPGRINVRAEGPFSALLALNTRDGRQSISISSPGSPLSEVAISMSRGK